MALFDWWLSVTSVTTGTYGTHVCVVLARTIYTRRIYSVIGREITKYTVYIYGSGQPYVCVLNVELWQKENERKALAAL